VRRFVSERRATEVLESMMTRLHSCVIKQAKENEWLLDKVKQALFFIKVSGSDKRKT